MGYIVVFFGVMYANQGFALFHELGHATGILPQDVDRSTQDRNNTNIAEKCAKALKLLGGF